MQLREASDGTHVPMQTFAAWGLLGDVGPIGGLPVLQIRKLNESGPKPELDPIVQSALICSWSSAQLSDHF